jgi:hypothetical protein
MIQLDGVDQNKALASCLHQSIEYRTEEVPDKTHRLK